MSTIKKETLQRLLEKFDSLSFGFPKSWLKADKGLTKVIFSEEHAQTFLKMEHGYQTAKRYAEVNHISEEEAKKELDSIAMQGLVFRRHRPEGDEYATHPFVFGFFEWQVKNTNKNYLIQVGMYMMSSKFGKRMSQTMPFYRTIPHKPDQVEGGIVQPYDNVDALIDRHTRFAVAPCICRLMYRMKPGNKCNHPIETCIETDDYADFYIEAGIGREITKEEAKAIIRAGEKDGRVINVTNSQDGENICSCCKCGCGMLYLKTKYPGPSGKLWSNYHAEWNPEKCTHCGLCVKKCGFGYLKQTKDGKITVNTDLCLGCGCCAGACPTKAMKIVQKPQDQLYEPPVNYDAAVEIWEKNTVKDYKHGK